MKMTPEQADMIIKYVTGQVHPEMALSYEYAKYVLGSFLTGGLCALGVWWSTVGDIIREITKK